MLTRHKEVASRLNKYSVVLASFFIVLSLVVFSFIFGTNRRLALAISDLEDQSNALMALLRLFYAQLIVVLLEKMIAQRLSGNPNGEP